MSSFLTVRRRDALVLAAFLAADAALTLAACSTSAPDGPADATVDNRTPDARTDAPVAARDAQADAGGNCSPATGACDIVLQNCPAQQECAVDNDGKAACQPVQVAQQLPLGRACCPSSSSNPCLPGLTCVGSACTDGGPATGRCSPACCKGADQACGKSDPEGISGACDLTLVDRATKAPLYNVCTYRKRCQPFGVEPCGAGETCRVEDTVGTAACVTSAGKGNRQPCSFANECADGYICLGTGDARVCHTACLFPGATHPFDASVEQGGALKGGCPALEKCELRLQDRPSWFAACSLDGG